MADAKTDPPLTINAQYVRDLSFENPNAPEVFSALSTQSPALNVIIDVATTPVHERTFEVVLTVRVQATVAEKTAFLIELDYAGLATLGASVTEPQAERLLMIETPRHLFPFARSVLASVTGDGGFPPVMINPIDFEQFYRRHRGGRPPAAAVETPDAEDAAVASEA